MCCCKYWKALAEVAQGYTHFQPLCSIFFTMWLAQFSLNRELPYFKWSKKQDSNLSKLANITLALLILTEILTFISLQKNEEKKKID